MRQTGDDLENRLFRPFAIVLHQCQTLHAGNLVASRAGVFGDLGLDDDLRVELVGNAEVGSLVETGQPIGTLGLAVQRTSTHSSFRGLDIFFYRSAPS